MTSGHLPECLHDDATYGLHGLCICDELRACEQRMLSLNPVALGVLIAQRARERALDAAREAVERWYDRDSPTVRVLTVDGVRLALAAIDALREKP